MPKITSVLLFSGQVYFLSFTHTPVQTLNLRVLEMGRIVLSAQKKLAKKTSGFHSSAAPPRDENEMSTLHLRREGVRVLPAFTARN